MMLISCKRLCALALFAFLLAGFVVTAGAQVVDLAATRLRLSPIDTVWRFHTGDDPHWADPTFNDTAWTTLEPSRQWERQGYTETDGMAWFRFQLLAPAHSSSLVIELPDIGKNYQLFANGRLVGQVGTLPPGKPSLVVGAARLFSVPVADTPSPQVVTIALRLWYPPSLVGVQTSVLNGAAYAGESSPVMDRFSNEKAVSALSAGNDYTESVVGIVAGAAALLLFWLTRERLYLWLSVYLGASIAGMPATFAAEHFAWSFTGHLNIRLVSDFIQFFTLSLFIFGVLHLHGWRLRVAAAFLSLAPSLSLLLVVGQIIPLRWGDLLYLLFVVAIFALLLVCLTRAWRAGVPDAGLLLIGILIDAIPPVLHDLGGVLITFHLPFGHFFDPIDLWQITQPFPVSVDDLRYYLLVFCLLIVLVFRFGRSNRDQQRLSTALQSAHDVQHGLVPSNLPAFGGLRANVAYIAAEEVGGDFCQVLERPDGSVLAVIGDVSGKGLQAAMLGTLAVGSLRTLADEILSPGDVLQRVNNIVLRTEYPGFITCLCVILQRSGEVSMANAGHLAPYLNGAELAVEPGLPLGIVPEASFDEFTCMLPPAARLTLLSDGVIEARSIGGELFGFDRTTRISHLAAAEIAAQAREHGQQDDITIVTLDWVAPAVALAS